MKKTKILLLLTIVSLGLVGCSSPSATDSDKLAVTVTTSFLGDLVEQIGKEHVTVTTLMGAGIDPHQYQASNDDLNKLTTADIIFYSGLHLEAKLGDVLEKISSEKTVYNVSDVIDESKLLLAQPDGQTNPTDRNDGLYDPHIWFDIEIWESVAKEVATRLSENDEEHRADYEQNLNNYLKELETLKSEVKEKIATIPEQSRYLVTAHDAFKYFARFTGMEVRGIQGVSTVTEAGLKDVSELADFIVQHQIKAVFVESSVSPKMIEALQEAVRSKGFETSIGGELFSDATGTYGTPEGTYLGMYRHNVETIVNALK